MLVDAVRAGARVARFASLAALLTTHLIGCDAGDDPDAADLTADIESAQPQALLAGDGLTLTGTSNLTLSQPDGYAHIFDGVFSLTNKKNKTVTLDKHLFFFAGPGGYATGSPSFDAFWPDPIPANATDTRGTFGWGWSTPVAHLVHRVDGHTTSGGSVAVLAGVPVKAAGFASPGPSPYTDDIDIGVQAPLEILNLTSGERWLPITGTVVDTTRTASTLPAITMKARNPSGNNVATLSLGYSVDGDFPVISRFIGWTALPAGKNVADVRITASQAIAGATATQTRTIAVVTATPLTLNSFVSGTWMWKNGPGEAQFHAHTANQEGRYAYDLGIHKLVNGQLQSFQGNPHVNASYFCWNKPIRAGLAGTVRLVVDFHPDNHGDLQDLDEGNNEIIIEHANGTFARYTHIRQGTAAVTDGQVVAAGTLIGRVGNAGTSSEPHLHFHAFKIDATGRQAAVPVSVIGMKSTAGVSLTGIPKGDTMYETP